MQSSVLWSSCKLQPPSLHHNQQVRVKQTLRCKISLRLLTRNFYAFFLRILRISRTFLSRKFWSWNEENNEMTAVHNSTNHFNAPYSKDSVKSSYIALERHSSFTAWFERFRIDYAGPYCVCITTSQLTWYAGTTPRSNPKLVILQSTLKVSFRLQSIKFTPWKEKLDL